MNDSTIDTAKERAAGVQMQAITGIPDVVPGDDLVEHILSALDGMQLSLKDGDILVIAHKVVSKAEGQIVDLAQIEPSQEAFVLAKQLNKKIYHQ